MNDSLSLSSKRTRDELRREREREGEGGIMTRGQTISDGSVRMMMGDVTMLHLDCHHDVNPCQEEEEWNGDVGFRGRACRRALRHRGQQRL